MTWYPAADGPAHTIFFVSSACGLLRLVTVSYTQVSPTATGNGIDPADTKEFEVVPDVPDCVPPPGGLLEAPEAVPVEGCWPRRPPC